VLNAARHNCVLLVEHPGAPIAGVDAVFKELGQVLVRAASAAQALRHARGTGFVLILAGLPGDGAEQVDLLRQLRANPRSSQSPLIVLAPHAGAAFPLEACYEAGAIDVLTGPVAPVILKAKARFFVDAMRTASERRRAEQAPRDTRVRLDSTVAAAELAMWSWDMVEDRVTGDANMAWLFNASPEAAAGGPISAYHAAPQPDDVSLDKANIRRAIDSGESYESTVRVLAADGEYHSVISRGPVLYDSAGKPEPAARRHPRHHTRTNCAGRTARQRGALPHVVRGHRRGRLRHRDAVRRRRPAMRLPLPSA
jgi:CheY-like chemotaxis protein